jgi:hypothetical protein
MSKGKSKGKIIIVEPNSQKANRLKQDLQELLIDIEVEIVNSKDQVHNEHAGVVLGEEDTRTLLFSILRNHNSQIDYINTRVDQQIENITSKIDSIKQSVDQIQKWLTGNGHPEQGYIVRIDRLERAESERKDSDRAKNNAIWAAIISAIASAVAAIISAILSF